MIRQGLGGVVYKLYLAGYWPDNALKIRRPFRDGLVQIRRGCFIVSSGDIMETRFCMTQHLSLKLSVNIGWPAE